MLAVYDGQKLIYKTLIASGVTRPNDPDRDYRTPKGSFKIDGSYRPKSQTMEGGASDKANPDYYKLEQVRNVSYFYQDYSIHGTYWHARFGTVPQSHGCVNSTVYDAGLIYQLKAGTVVEIY
jgi:lipoprotein-anchoring transpeptidase ErfK/SrfK